MNMTWHAIDELDRAPDLLLAYAPPGRMMIWSRELLARNLKGPTPEHLQFPATHWIALPQAPSEAVMPNAQNREQETRSSFEHWMSDGGKWMRAVERNGEGYSLAQTQNSWIVWKARKSTEPSTW